MLAFFCFLITIIGSLNWLCIGFFQFDFVAGLFGTQSSIFSRLIYIIIGFASVFLTYAVIRYKGRLTIKKNKNQDQVLMNKQPLPDGVASNNLIQSNENQNSNSNQYSNQNPNENNSHLNNSQENLHNQNQQNTTNNDNHNN